MIRSIRIVAGLAAVAAAAAFTLPAGAQYANEFSLAKLRHQGTTSKPIAGSGMVVVQVLVKPNGSHRVIKVIRSTNPADNAAAIDIAQNSSYSPAHRGTKAVPSYYDFTLKFNGRSVARWSQSVAKGGAAARIDALLHQHNYTAAKAQALAALAHAPGNAVLNEELGTAEYFLADYDDAAAAFDKVSTVTRTFAQVAAQSYAMAAAKGAGTPQMAVAYGKKAVALAPGSNSEYALGTAELNAGQNAAAVGDLKKAFDLVQADPKADKKTKVQVAAQLYEAYSKSGDTADAAKTLALIKQIDPSNTAVQTLQGNQYLEAGNTAAQAGNHADALKDFLQAANGGSPQVQVTAYAAAAFQQSALLAASKTPPTKDDYAKVKAYADKALAINPNDPQANFAEGIGLAGEYIVGGKQDASLKTQALAALNKAKAEAQSANNFSLSLSIDNFIKQSLPQ